MAIKSDYISGTLTITQGSTAFTGTGTGWRSAEFKEGDTLIDITGATEYMGVIESITGEASGTLTKAWEGPSLVNVPYRMRYQPDGARSTAQARNLIEILGNGNITAFALLNGAANLLPMFTGPGAMTLVTRQALVSGAAYDVQVPDLAGRAAYDGQDAGYSVLVSDVGDGRSAIYSKNSATSGDWSDPAYVTGPVVTIAAGTTTTLSDGLDATVALRSVPGGYELDFGIPRGQKGDTGEKGDTGDKGDKGDRGEGLTINANGPLAGRDAYDSEAEGFTYVDTENGNLYFRETSTPGVWSSPIPFGKGEKGDAGTSGAAITTTNGVGNGTVGPYVLDTAPNGLDSILSASISGVLQYDYTISGTGPYNITFAIAVPSGVAWQVKQSGPLAVGQANSLVNGIVDANSITNDSSQQALIRDKLGIGSGGGGSIAVEATRAGIKALNTTNVKTVYLSEVGREGIFFWTVGNYAARVTNDPAEGIYIASNGTASSSGAWVRFVQGRILDKWFGVKADAVLDSSQNIVSGTDDTVALKAFGAFMKYRKTGYYGLSGGIRRVFSSMPSHGEILLDIAGCEGIDIKYLDNASIHAVNPAPNAFTGTSVIPLIWHITGADRVSINKPSLTVEGKVTGAVLHGPFHFDWGWNQTINTPFKNISITEIKQLGGVGGLRVGTPSSPSGDVSYSEGIEFTGHFQQVYYPINLQGNGDNANINITTDRCVRSVFLYNVTGANIQADIQDPAISSGTVNLTCYNTPTMRNILANIKVKAKVRGGWNSSPASGLANNTILFPINAIHTSGTSVKIRDIHYDLDVLVSNNAAGGKVIAINKYNNSGTDSVADTSPRGHQIQGITWSGSVEGNFTGDVEPFSLFMDNPVGSENWTGDQISNCGFEKFYAQGSEMDINFDGRGVNTTIGYCFIRDSFFGGTAHSLNNSLGKLAISNSGFISNDSVYTPVWAAPTTNPAIGNGVLAGSYEIDGDYCIARIRMTAGSTTTFGSGNWTFSLPITPKVNTVPRFGSGRVFDAGTANIIAVATILANQTTLSGYGETSGNNFNASSPIAWTTSDSLELEIRYKYK